MAAISELPGEQDLPPGEHTLGAIRKRSGTFGQQKARHPKQVWVTVSPVCPKAIALATSTPENGL
jgi:hypothetical protein